MGIIDLLVIDGNGVPHIYDYKTSDKEDSEWYNSKEDASECYKFEGTITFAGSKYEDPDPISSMAYCRYDGAWYLVGN